MDLMEKKDIAPMLLASQKQPFDDEDYIFELKLDGIRCIAYLDSNRTNLRNKRNKELLSLYPELKDLHLQVKKPCILDGELVVLNRDGSPNFALLQKRSLLTDKLKIEIESEKHKVHFVAYDILYIDGISIVDKPLLERKKHLKDNIKENNLLNISRFISTNGIKLFNLTKQLSLEGIVAKRKDSEYEIGKRSKSWIKIKNLIDEDLLICVIKLYENGLIKYLILCEKKNDGFLYRGKVFLNISKEEQKIILNFAKSQKLKSPLFKNLQDKDIVWIKPELYCTIEYMHLTKDNNMRQPVFKSLRDDK